MIVDEKKEASADLMRKEYSANREQNSEIIQTAHDMLEMYKQGYLDGYIGYMQERKGKMASEEKSWLKLKHKCSKAFTARFMVPAQKRLAQSEKEVIENGKQD